MYGDCALEHTSAMPVLYGKRDGEIVRVEMPGSLRLLDDVDDDIGKDRRNERTVRT